MVKVDRRGFLRVAAGAAAALPAVTRRASAQSKPTITDVIGQRVNLRDNRRSPDLTTGQLVKNLDQSKNLSSLTSQNLRLVQELSDAEGVGR